MHVKRIHEYKRQLLNLLEGPFLFLLSPIRAREARAAAAALGWLMAERWSPEPAMVRRATGSSPTDRQIPRTDTGGLTSLAQRFALKDQRNRPVFISSLTYTRARGARRRRGARLADGRTISEVERLDMDAVRAKLSPQFIAAHSTKTVTVTVKTKLIPAKVAEIARQTVAA